MNFPGKLGGAILSICDLQITHRDTTQAEFRLKATRIRLLILQHSAVKRLVFSLFWKNISACFSDPLPTPCFRKIEKLGGLI